MVDAQLVGEFSQKDLEIFEQVFVEAVCRIQMVRMENENILDQIKRENVKSAKLDVLLEDQALLISRIDDKMTKMNLQ